MPGRSKKNKPTNLPAKSKTKPGQPASNPLGHVLRAQYQGPLPDGNTLEHYERTLPGAAKILFTQFEKQGNHRRWIEKVTVFSEYGLRFGSQIGATVLGLAFAGLGGYLILQGHNASGLLVFGTTVVSAVVVNKKAKGQ